MLSFYAATDLVAGEAGTDPDETVDVGLFSAVEVRRLLTLGQVDVKTIAGLALEGLLGDAVLG